jgi:hypothetical protein
LKKADLLKIRIGEYQKLRFKRVRGQADLVYRKKDDTFFLIVTVDVPEEEEEVARDEKKSPKSVKMKRSHNLFTVA